MTATAWARSPSSLKAVTIESGIVARPAIRPILVADDDATARSSLVEVLAARYHVYEAVDGPAAAEAARIMPVPAAILCAIPLPKLDAFKLAAFLRQQPRLRNVPLVFLGDSPDPDHMNKARLAGARRFILKPFVASTVFDIVTKLTGA